MTKTFTAGLLGATSPYFSHLTQARLDKIERHILRIEKAMREAGIEVDDLPLDKEN